jgi:hypothetical protein
MTHATFIPAVSMALGGYAKAVWISAMTLPAERLDASLTGVEETA